MLKSLLLFALLFASPCVYLCSEEEIQWNYTNYGPDIWPNLFPQCAGSAQSPIDIKPQCTVYQSFPAFNFSDFYEMNQTFMIINNGHTIVANQTNRTEFPLLLTGGGLKGVYQFVNFHLHWGDNYGTGSEHQIGGKKYAGEVHFVHKNTNGSDYAALSFLITTIKLGTHNSADRRIRRVHESEISLDWIYFLQDAAELEEPMDSVNMNLTLKDFMGRDLENFWRYQGSFTTPNCDEIVTWTVFNKEIEINDQLIERLRKNIIPSNFRPPQPLNDRTVFRSVENVTNTSGATSHCCS